MNPANFIRDLTDGQVKTIELCELAIVSILQAAYTDKLAAAAGTFGLAMQLITEEGLDELACHSMVQSWFLNHGDVRAEMQRRQMKLISVPDEKTP